MKKIKKLFNILKNQYFLLAILLVLGFGARLYKLDNPVADWHSWRQADTISVARIYQDFGIEPLNPRYYDISSIQTGSFNKYGLRLVEFPIYNIVQAALAKAVPISYPSQLLSKSWKSIGYTPSALELWGRLLSIFSSLGSGLFLFLVARKIYNKWVGLVSLFAFMLIPYNIYFSRVLLPEPMAVFFAMGGLYFFSRFIESESKSSIVLSGVFYAGALLLKPFAFFYFFPAIYMLIKKYGIFGIFKNSKLFIWQLVFVNVAFVPFFVWRWYINLNPIGIPHFSWAFNGDGIRFKPAFWRWIFAERVGNLILGVWGVIPLAYGLIAKWESKYKYFSHVFLLGAVSYLTIVATANVRHDYYQSFIVPALALGVGVGAYKLWSDTHFNQIISRGLLLFVFFVMFVAGWVQIKADYAVNHPEIVVAGMAADRLLPSEAKVIAPYNGDTAFLYQTHRFGWPVVDTSIDTLKERGAEYFVAVNFADPDVAMLEAKYKTLARTDQYIIIDLNQEIEK